VGDGGAILTAARELGEAMALASEALGSGHWRALQEVGLEKVGYDALEGGALSARQMVDLAAYFRNEVDYYAGS